MYTSWQNERNTFEIHMIKKMNHPITTGAQLQFSAFSENGLDET